MTNTATSASISAEEVEKFSAIADEWWDEEGKFKPLHQLNPTRLAYIRDKICELFDRDVMADKPLKGINILDIGCGGGLLCVPLTRLGATVTGIDAGDKNIKVASVYAKKQGLDVDYQCISAEELAAKPKRFDVVLNMEVIEHVADVDSFMAACTALVKDGGLMFTATLNRTAKSYAFAIVGAEYVLNWLPRGTHDWHKFLKPHEIESHFQKENLTLLEIRGVSFQPFAKSWQLTDDISVNYMMLAQKD